MQQRHFSWKKRDKLNSCKENIQMNPTPQILQITLKHFGFGENFRKWIATIYKSTQCCVTNNGYHSKFFQISRGIRQGCPISALLFILVVEVMANSIRKNDRIKGIQLNDKTIKISQLVDDTTLLVQDIESVKIVLGFLSDFSTYSGLKLKQKLYG